MPRNTIAFVTTLLLLSTAWAAAQQSRGIVLDIKPTLSGYANNAFVETGNVGPEKKEMTVFRRNQNSPGPLVVAEGGEIWGTQIPFAIGQTQKELSGDAHVAIDGDTQFIGNLDYEGSTYTFVGTVRLMRHRFSSDQKDPLVFNLVKNTGLVYVKGTGKVTLPSGTTLTIPARGK